MISISHLALIKVNIMDPVLVPHLRYVVYFIFNLFHKMSNGDTLSKASLFDIQWATKVLHIYIFKALLKWL